MSDIIVEAEGTSFENAFVSLAEGMFTQMGSAKPKEKISLDATGENLEVLVVNALSDLLAELEIQRFTPAKLEVNFFDKDKCKLGLTVFGESKQPKNIIKAVTFHEILVKETKGKWTLRVLFDI
jgi:SHS2 domain-containing protein